MRTRKGLSKIQIVFIILLWVFLCIMLFTLQTGQTMAEKVLYSIVSGAIIFAGVYGSIKKMNKRDNNRK